MEVLCITPKLPVGGTLALADKLERAQRREDLSKIGLLLFALDRPDADALQKVLEDPGIPHTEIARVLKAEYRETEDKLYDVSVASVKRYRDGLGVSVRGTTR